MNVSKRNAKSLIRKQNTFDPIQQIKRRQFQRIKRPMEGSPSNSNKNASEKEVREGILFHIA
jgi:hypothetical protein